MKRSAHPALARRGIATAIAAAFGAAAIPAWPQLPTGPAVVNGTAGIVSDGTQMTITNSPNAVLNWQGFSIGANNSVRFDQANAASRVLNRVIGNDPSNILGSLRSNGKVWLVNPHGVLFGANARVNVGGLVASSLAISNEDFLAGRSRFDDMGKPAGQVLNQGELNTSLGGHVLLVGGSVGNEGLIRSPGGQIVLAAGKSVELVDSGAPNVVVRVTAAGSEAVNLGTLLAPAGGSIDIHGGIVNQQGIVRADSVGTDPAGRIVIKASGDVQLSAGSQTSASAEGAGVAGKVLVESIDGATLVQGRASATSTGGAGGLVHLLGKNVGVYGQALVDASGATAGGEVLAGGDYQGKNPLIRNAAATYLGPNATVLGNATGTGTGGKVIFWGDEVTRMYGSIAAKGGPLGGDGGFIETSGSVLDVRTDRISVAATKGKAGTWLLDPGDIHISDLSSLNIDFTDPSSTVFFSGALKATASAADIANALSNGTNVIVKTGRGDDTTLPGNIYVEKDIIVPVSATPSGGLSLQAHSDIVMNPGVKIVAGSSPLAVSFLADLDRNGVGNIQLQDGASIATNGGNITMVTQSNVRSPSANISIARNSALDAGVGRVTLTAPEIRVGTGDLSTFPGSGEPTIKGGSIALEANTVNLDHASLSASNTGDAMLIRTLNFSTTSSQLSASNGRWLILLNRGLTAFPDLDTLDYTFVEVGTAGGLGSGIPGNGVLMYDPLNVQIKVSATRQYDGTEQALFSDALALKSLPGFAVQPRPSDSFIEGRFTDKNVGTNKPIIYSGEGYPFRIVTLKGVPVSGVNQSYVGDIEPKLLSVSGLLAANKVYDGNQIANLSGTLTGVIVGDNVSLTGLTGEFDTKRSGTGKTVTVAGGSLSGTDARNYALTGGATTTADILRKSVTVASLVADDKVYDGNRSATVHGILSGIIEGDDAALGGASGQFDTKNAGCCKTVTISGGSLTGTDAGNYLLTGDTIPITTAAILRKPITAAGIVADNKIYDGTRAANLHGAPSGIIAGDDAALGGASGQFDTRNAGTGKTVTIAGGSLSGADAGNYLLTGGATTTADITPRPITVAGVLANDKVYDGQRDATLSGGFTEALPGDAVQLGTTAGLFDNKNAGTDKTVSFANDVLAGADAGNYMLTGPLTAKASIKPRPMTIALTGEVTKEYDATPAANLGGVQFVLDGLLANDTVTIRGPAQGSYDTPAVGQQKLVRTTGPFEVSGADAPNYRIGSINLTAGANVVNVATSANIGSITPALLTYTATPVTSEPGLPVSGLDGTVTGFKGTDSLSSATTGTLLWQSDTMLQSPAGTYAINGTGLNATNYRFVQAPGNASALVLKVDYTPSKPQLQAQESSVLAANSALQSAIPPIDPRGSGGGVFDRSSPGAARTFSAIRIGSMNQDELARMLAARREFKKKLFADAIYKLDIDPSLADVQPCPAAVDAASGACRLTTSQLELMRAAKPQAAVASAVHANVASLPQIQRKVIVLFGINNYEDKTIPPLENAVPDVDAVAKIFAEKLGYEVRVVRNPNKADIIRTLNTLATEMHSEDSVVIYYAGHGYSLEKNGAGYWLPSDARANDPRGWISNSDVAKLLSNVGAKQMALISDSCYSGAFAREGMDAVGHDVKAADVLNKRSVVVLSSGGDEPVADEGKEGHSIFAWNLMQVVGTVTDWKPGSTIFTNVQSAVRKEFPQTPKYGSVTAAGHQPGGDYLFEFR